MFHSSRRPLQLLLILLWVTSLGACSSLPSLTPSFFNNKPSQHSFEAASVNNSNTTQSFATSEANSSSTLSPLVASSDSPLLAASYVGKLHLQMIADEENKKSFNLDFELQGNAKQGQFDLIGPLGAQLAQLQWNTNSASLRQGKKEQNADNLKELLQPLLGFEFPLQALFSWLETNNTQELENLTWSAQNTVTSTGKRALRLEQKFPKVFNTSATETNTNNVTSNRPDSSAFTFVKVLLILQPPDNSVAQ